MGGFAAWRNTPRIGLLNLFHDLEILDVKSAAHARCGLRGSHMRMAFNAPSQGVLAAPWAHLGSSGVAGPGNSLAGGVGFHHLAYEAVGVAIGVSLLALGGASRPLVAPRQQAPRSDTARRSCRS